MTLHLHGVGHYHPETEITNDFLESLDIGTNNDWIVDRVGIRTRRTVLPLDYIRETRNQDIRAGAEAVEIGNKVLGARAARLAMERAGIEPEQVGMVISGTTSPTNVCPAEACMIAGELGIQAPAFDLNSACSTFVTQLFNLSLMDPKAVPDYILTVAVESLTPVIDYTDRAGCVLFGDGAAAAVISTRHPGRAQILHLNVESDPAGADKVIIPWAGFFSQDGRAVQMFAIRRTQSGYERICELREQEGGAADRTLHFIGHQANLRVLEQVCKRAQIDPALHHSNVAIRGNTGGASAPSVLSMHWEKFTPRDDVAVVVVGGGLTWARMLVRFGAEL